jgi:hypothetical protein
MQNAKCKMQTANVFDPDVAFCILHSAFCFLNGRGHG